MKIGMVGLGRMGANIVRRLKDRGHDCVAFDIDARARAAIAAEGAAAAGSLAELVAALPSPKIVWVMVPAGAATDAALSALGGLLGAGDIVIDGGNSNFKTTRARGAELATRGVDLVDVGTSGGVFGRERGYCLMIGGAAAAVERCAPIFEALAPGRDAAPRTPARASGAAHKAEEGWLHCGPSGAGHYVKMVHNGVEYGMMQAFAEGFALLESAGVETLPAGRRYDIDCAAVAELWRRGSVVSSWLLDLTADALAETPALDAFSAQVQDSGEGRWTVEAAVEQAVPAPVLTAALFARFRSRQSGAYADRLLSAMRFKFGGHTATKK